MATDIHFDFSFHASCKCYVRFIEGDHILFCLRLGIHNPACPVYRASLDPVNRRADDDFRARIENPVLREARSLIR